jgi:hypothetical protein
MAHPRKQPGDIEDQAALSALISTGAPGDRRYDRGARRRWRRRRHCGPARPPADGFYYHLRRLVDAGVLREGEDRGDGRGRRYSTVAQRGKRVHLKYGRGSRSNTGTVAQVVAGMLRTAERDFAKGLRSGTASGAGELRDLWASRLKGWVNDAELREINRMLVRLGELLQQPRDPRRNRLVTLAWMLAPIDGKPLRRAAPRRGARKARPAAD